MAQWSFIAQGRNGAAVGDLSPFLRDRKIELLLNRPSIVTGTINLNAPTSQLSWLVPGQSELKVLRDGEAIETVFVLTSVNVGVGKESGSLELEWMSISSYLKDLAVLAGTTKNLAQSEHCWELINEAQARTGASVYAITRGAIPSTDPTKQSDYADAIDVLGAIEKLAARADGFDFAINTEREFDCYYPYRGSSSGVVLEYDNGGNVQGFNYKIDASPGHIITDLVGKGGNQQLVTASDATARDAYGRRESYVVYPSEVTSVTTLQQSADEDLNAAKAPIIIPQVSLKPGALEWGSYDLGDTIELRLRAGSGDFVNVNEDYRVTGITIALTEVDAELISLELNEARLVV